MAPLVDPTPEPAPPPVFFANSRKEAWLTVLLALVFAGGGSWYWYWAYEGSRGSVVGIAFHGLFGFMILCHGVRGLWRSAEAFYLDHDHMVVKGGPAQGIYEYRQVQGLDLEQKELRVGSGLVSWILPKRKVCRLKIRMVDGHVFLLIQERWVQRSASGYGDVRAIERFLRTRLTDGRESTLTKR